MNFPIEERTRKVEQNRLIGILEAREFTCQKAGQRETWSRDGRDITLTAPETEGTVFWHNNGPINLDIDGESVPDVRPEQLIALLEGRP